MLGGKTGGVGWVEKDSTWLYRSVQLKLVVWQVGQYETTSSGPQKSGDRLHEQKREVDILGSANGVFHSMSVEVIFINQLAGGSNWKYSSGPDFHNGEFEFKSAGNDED